MKRIPLKTLGEEQQEGYVDYAATLRNIVRAPSNPREGINFEEMKKAIRLFEALDAVQGEELLLEDADHVFLASRVKSFRWAYSHPNIVTFINDVLEAPEAA